MQSGTSRMSLNLFLTAVLAFLSFGSMAQTTGFCSWTWGSTGCVGCKSTWGNAYKWVTQGCVGCGSWCMAYLQEPVDGKAAEEKILVTSDPTALARSLFVPVEKVREMAATNPWAAAAIIGIHEAGLAAELRSGHMMFNAIPTTASVIAQLNGESTQPFTLPLQKGMHAKAEYRLERGPGPVAKMHISALAVDDDGRTQYKAYPDVMLDLVETDRPRSVLMQSEIGDAAKGEFIARNWSVAR